MIQHSNIHLQQFASLFFTLPIIFALIFFISNGYADDGYPNTEWMGGQVDKNSDWYKQCIKVKDAQPPKSDLPAEQLAASLHGCNATDLYYEVVSGDFSTKAAWENTKNCAFASNDEAVLMMLYANGFGVSKNMNLATMYACKVGGAPAEAKGRISHLSSMSDNRDDATFDLCDDITSGYMQGVCTSISENQSQKARTAQLREIIEKLAPSQKEEFSKLQQAQADFAKHISDDETDASGTGRAAFMIEAEATEMDRFVDDLEEFEKGNTPRFTKEQFAALDKTLNLVYRNIMRAKVKDSGSRIGFTTITKEGIKNTQKAWLKYRNAWVAFGRLKHPGVDPLSWKGLYTERRIAQLKDLLEMAE